MGPEITESIDWLDHPRYGKVRMLVRQVMREGRPDGAPISLFDLDFEPELPRGALRGTPRNCAPFCNYCNSPKYFYQDQTLQCVQCDSEFVFSAVEQKHWFEVIKVHIRTRCLRCPSCRKRRKTEKALQRQLQEALDLCRAEPDNEALHIDVAKAMVENISTTGRGDLPKAISHARKGRALTDHYSQSWYWEGEAHDLAGRTERAQECFQTFLKRSLNQDNLKELRDRALASLKP
jgi:Probable zinc-ribbon domain